MLFQSHEKLNQWIPANKWLLFDNLQQFLPLMSLTKFQNSNIPYLLRLIL